MVCGAARSLPEAVATSTDMESRWERGVRGCASIGGRGIKRMGCAGVARCEAVEQEGVVVLLCPTLTGTSRSCMREHPETLPAWRDVAVVKRTRRSSLTCTACRRAVGQRSVDTIVVGRMGP